MLSETTVSPRQGSFVLLQSYLRRCVTASSAFCQSSSTTRPSTQSLHIWSSGFFCRGSGCLELHEPLLTANSYLKLVCLLSTSAHSALEVLHIMRYIHLLTYSPKPWGRARSTILRSRSRSRSRPVCEVEANFLRSQPRPREKIKLSK